MVKADGTGLGGASGAQAGQASPVPAGAQVGSHGVQQSSGRRYKVGRPQQTEGSPNHEVGGDQLGREGRRQVLKGQGDCRKTARKISGGPDMCGVLEAGGQSVSRGQEGSAKPEAALCQ